VLVRMTRAAVQAGGFAGRLQVSLGVLVNRPSVWPDR
jgi:hypothetical protein